MEDTPGRDQIYESRFHFAHGDQREKIKSMKKERMASA